MIVYGPQVSPFVRKVLVFAAEKGLEVQNPPGVGPSPDPGFLAASPFRKIPALRDGDFTLCDSSAIVAYVDKVRPDPGLIPAEPKAHARAVWYDEFADTILGPAALSIFFNRVLARRLGREPDLAAADRAERDQLPLALDYLESVIPASGFLVQDRLTLADIAVASFFVNLGYAGVTTDKATHPKTAAYVAALLERPSFAGLIAGDAALMPPDPTA
jgi:glutathione S-transferase